MRQTRRSAPSSRWCTAVTSAIFIYGWTMATSSLPFNPMAPHLRKAAAARWRGGARKAIASCATTHNSRLTESQTRPTDSRSPLDTVATIEFQYEMHSRRFRERRRFLGGYREHAPPLGNRTITERQHHHTARTHLRCHVGHGPPALRRIEMHPNRGEHHDIEGFASRQNPRQIRQVVVDPFDRRRWMQRHRANP